MQSATLQGVSYTPIFSGRAITLAGRYELKRDDENHNRKEFDLSSMGDLALTIEERAQGEFFWVVLEAVTDESQDEMVYRRLRAAEQPQESYSSALAVGSLMLRRLNGRP